MIIISERLKQLRKQRGLTQSQLGELFGLRSSTISAYESGDRSPSYATLLRYAAYFHVTTDYILEGSNKNLLDVTGLNDSELASIHLLIEAYKSKR